MKKYFFILVLFLVMVITVSAKSVDNTLDINNLNSNNLLEYLNQQDLNGKDVMICNQDYCDYLKHESLEKSVKTYINDYLNFVKEKTDADTSVRVSLKGFLITEIIYS